MAVLEPLWRRAPETASRVRGRIEAVLDYAKARGWRSGENPARWRGHVAHMLPPKRRLAPVRHHPSVAWQRAGALAAELRAQEGIAARAVEFVLLTAARSGEVRGARWGEFDLDAGMWMLPPARMKSGREFRVPLSVPALALLRGLLPLRRSADGLVFPGRSGARALDDTALSRALRRAAPRARAPPCTGCGRPSAVGAPSRPATRARSRRRRWRTSSATRSSAPICAATCLRSGAG
jgi:integrase